jgi:hypothetical protein
MLAFIYQPIKFLINKKVLKISFYGILFLFVFLDRAMEEIPPIHKN